MRYTNLFFKFKFKSGKSQNMSSEDRANRPLNVNMIWCEHGLASRYFTFSLYLPFLCFVFKKLASHKQKTHLQGITVTVYFFSFSFQFYILHLLQAVFHGHLYTCDGNPSKVIKNKTKKPKCTKLLTFCFLRLKTLEQPSRSQQPWIKKNCIK